MSELLIKNIETEDYKLFFQELSDLVAKHCYSFEIEDNNSFPVQLRIKQENGRAEKLVILKIAELIEERKEKQVTDAERNNGKLIKWDRILGDVKAQIEIDVLTELKEKLSNFSA